MSRDPATDFVVRVRSANLRARVDAVTAEVVRELRADGLRPLLLKGPSLAELLYDADSPRAYLDTDLLVGPAQHAAAERCLARLGFERTLAGSDVPGSHVAGHTWRRAGSGPAVDLHTTFHGVGAPPGELWEALSESARTIPVGGVDVEVPGVPACALIVALHAAHHGLGADHPREDLARALDRLDAGTWAAAARLAERLAAIDAFASGVTLHPAGAELAADLSLPSRLPVDQLLLRGDPPPGAVTLEALASTRGAGAKLRLAARKLVPSRRQMRFWFPRAAHGRVWLAVGYAWRPVWVVLAALPAFRAWRRARTGALARRRPRP